MSLWALTHDEAFQAALEKLIRDPDAFGMLHGSQRAFDDIFHIESRPDLVKDGSHVAHPGVGQQDEFQLGRRLEVMQLVLAGAVREELVVLPAQLTHHASEGEDGAEDEFGIVFRFQCSPRGGRHVSSIAGRCGGGVVSPALAVDALGWRQSVMARGVQLGGIGLGLTVAVEDVEGVDGHVCYIHHMAPSRGSLCPLASCVQCVVDVRAVSL